MVQFKNYRERRVSGAYCDGSDQTPFVYSLCYELEDESYEYVNITTNEKELTCMESSSEEG